MALLWIRTMLISPRLPSLTILLFDRLTRGILPKFSRQPLLYNDDEHNSIAHLEGQLQARQDINIKNRNVTFLPAGSTVVVLREDGGQWIHVMIIGNETDDHNGRNYRIRVTKTEHAISRMKRHLKLNNISAEDCLQN